MVHKNDNVPESRCTRERMPENGTPIAAPSPCRDGLAPPAHARCRRAPHGVLSTQGLPKLCS